MHLKSENIEKKISIFSIFLSEQLTDAYNAKLFTFICQKYAKLEYYVIIIAITHQHISMGK